MAGAFRPRSRSSGSWTSALILGAAGDGLDYEQSCSLAEVENSMLQSLGTVLEYPARAFADFRLTCFRYNAACRAFFRVLVSFARFEAGALV